MAAQDESDPPPLPPERAPAPAAKRKPPILLLAWALLIGVVGGYAAWTQLDDSEPKPDLGQPIAVIVPIPPPAPPPAPPNPPPVAQAPEPPPPAPPPPPVAVVEPPPPATPAATPPATPPPPAPRPAQPREQAATPAPTPPVQVEPAPPPPAAAQQGQPPRPQTPPPAQQAARPPLPPRDVEAPTWVRFSRPFDPQDRRPRIAIVMNDLGKSQAATNAAIQNLGGAITLAFSPYADNLTQWVALARAGGHEVLLNVPMEPTDFPATDPGPQTLLTTLSARQNLERLDALLGRAQGFVGIATFAGSRFTTSTDAMRPVVDRLFARGLLLLDARTAPNSLAARVAEEVGVPRAYADRLLDQEASRAAIDRALADLERLARANGAALGIAQPFPVTFERLINWLPLVEGRGFAIVPVSAVVNRQPAAAAMAPGTPPPAR
jgi:uncharacterized protein